MAILTSGIVDRGRASGKRRHQPRAHGERPGVDRKRFVP